MKMLKPKKVGEVRKLVGLLSVYRRFVPNFSRQAKPLYDLRKAPDATEKQIKSNSLVIWRTEHQEVTEKLIELITSFMVMAYPNFERPFVLHTDASHNGLGAVLYQDLQDEMRVILHQGR